MFLYINIIHISLAIVLFCFPLTTYAAARAASAPVSMPASVPASAMIAATSTPMTSARTLYSAASTGSYVASSAVIPTASPASPGAASGAVTAATTDVPSASGTELFTIFAQHAKKIQTLHTTFRQEKRISFLPEPVRSTGVLFFARSYAGGKPALLWEYDSPAPSGLWFARGQGWLWTQQRSSLHRAQGTEARVLSAMLQNILQWFTLDSQEFRLRYDIYAEKTRPCCTLVPQQRSFFTEMELCLTDNGRVLHSLRFQEAQGDSTLLTFDAPDINGKTLSAFPDGSPFPE